MAEENEIYTKKCKRCGNYFTTESKKVYVCTGCKKSYKSVYYGKKSAQEIQASGFPPISIKQIIRLLMRYNQKHNKSYSYGKFVEDMRTGKIRADDLYHT